MVTFSEIQEEKRSLMKYDVFLSFRGKDTRLGFIDFLYQALQNENVDTFLDEEEVETGEDLKPELARAIQNSRASVIVLSENYASSTWCLEELVMILEQRRTSNHIVLPIFYHVEPTHVRKQQNSFGDALVEHERRMEAENDEEKKRQRSRKLELWREGLTEVADLKGKDAKGCRETVFIEEIVNEIRSRLNLHLLTKIPKLIGMDSSIYKIRSWLREGSTNTGDILTICGLAGIGKTSLAEYMYRSHFHEFERSSFVEGIERKCAQNSSALLDFQKQILQDILKKRMVQVCDVNVSTAKIEKALISKRTLVVLDGIDNLEQLEVLIGTKGFHPGSKIIITTKDGSITKKSALFQTSFPPTHIEHRLHGISDDDSLRLLCWHAFRRYDPKAGYEIEARRVAEYCQGHPLALKVLGSSLINEDIAAWSDTFEMLEKKELHNDIQKVLQVSYDSLPSENFKELFKHIACFFVGMDKDVTETILNGCGIRASYGIKRLTERCLLTIQSGNKLMMHQLLQEMGRDLVHQESPKPWKRSRLWNHEESLNLLIEDKGTTKIQGLALDMKVLEKEMVRGSSTVLKPMFEDDDRNKNFRAFPLIHHVFKLFSRFWWFLTWFIKMFSASYCKKPELRTNALSKMEKLKLLQLNHVKLSGSYMNFPEDLRWLCMGGSQLKYIPSDLPMENLVALEMPCSELKGLWKKPKRLGSLKILNLSYCKFVTVGGFSELPALERLILKGCASLIHLCESIDQCDELVLLDLSYCIKLKKLPSNIAKLKKFQILSIDGCLGVREFPTQMKDISKSHPILSSVTELVPRNPKSFWVLLPPSVVSLSLVNNNLCNDSLPDFSSLTMLKKLYLDENPIDSMPDCVRSLPKIELLSVGECHMLKSIICLPSTIKHLYAGSCSSLMKITFHPARSIPPLVTYRKSRSLTEIQGIIKIQPLAQIGDMILSSLGWTDLRYLDDKEVQIWDSYMWSRAMKLPIQMFYEFGIFNTCFKGKEVPNWFAHRNNGPSISLILPSSPMNKSIQGLNICFVHTFSGTGRVSSLRTKISNMTKNRTWIHYGYIFAVQEADEDIVWLSHWMFGNNEFEDGDEVSVTIVEEEEDCGLRVRECAINILYNDGDKEEDPLSSYKSWKHIIGGDLSAFQLTSGDYFLNHERFFRPPYMFEELFQHTTTQKLLGYTPQYKR
ncbi:hypothetical protein OSB04_012419 [Centaurea solstitialis]|uniref:ADP-ribosyl cyclase/cyclic ADP-ribose hydrolase n=1 Tax=Centaurea solstitialis TaxID=347529 RepID=A0AA38TBB8_9ASTR|nr:hypothetical protein OSB04_012419 [Centaurea solstitialis]